MAIRAIPYKIIGRGTEKNADPPPFIQFQFRISGQNFRTPSPSTLWFRFPGPRYRNNFFQSPLPRIYNVIALIHMHVHDVREIFSMEVDGIRGAQWCLSNCSETPVSTLPVLVIKSNWLTIGSRHPNIAPYMSILPILTLTGSAAKCWPNGVKVKVVTSHAPISRRMETARDTFCLFGGSRASDRNSAGVPKLHFWNNKWSYLLYQFINNKQ